MVVTGGAQRRHAKAAGLGLLTRGQHLEHAHHPEIGVRDDVAVEHRPPGKSANSVRNVMLPPSGAIETVSR